MNLRRALSIALLLFGSLAPAAASAQTSEATKAAARLLTIEGYGALDKKDYAGAAERFTRADSLFHAPTIARARERSRGKPLAAPRPNGPPHARRRPLCARLTRCT